MSLRIGGLMALVVCASLELVGCGGGAAANGGAQSADSAAGGPRAVDQLEKLEGQLSAAVDGVFGPIDEAGKALQDLEALIRSAGDNGPQVVEIVVSVINTGSWEAPAPAAEPEPEAPSAQLQLPATASNPAKALAQAEPGAAPEVEHKEGLSSEVVKQSESLGQRLRGALAALDAMPDRGAALGSAAAEILVRVPPLAVEATATAQLDLANPFADAEAKAKAQADVKRIEVVVQGIQKRVAEVQQKVVSLPPRALQLVTQAQTVLLGAALKPPPAKSTVAIELPASAQTPQGDGARAAEQPGLQWGWYLGAGLAAGVAITGGVIYVSTNQQLTICNSSSGYGCANDDVLVRQNDWGLVLLSAGSAAALSLGTAGLMINGGNSERPAESGQLDCLVAGTGVTCGGRF